MACIFPGLCFVAIELPMVLSSVQLWASAFSTAWLSYVDGVPWHCEDADGECCKNNNDFHDVEAFSDGL